MNKAIKSVKYITCWDGCDEVKTNAKVDILTGEVIEIETVEVDNEYEICEGEFVQYEDGSIEQVVYMYDDRYFIISKSNQLFKTLEIYDTKYTVSKEIEEKDIHKIFSIAY